MSFAESDRQPGPAFGNPTEFNMGSRRNIRKGFARAFGVAI
jgi:hypothetical protein